MYKPAIKGTNFSQTFAIDCTPPSITQPVPTVKTIPVIYGDTPKLLCTIVEMELPCVILPIPKQAIPANTANATPSHFCFKPFSRAYIGPPNIIPSDVFTLYFTAKRPSPYFVAIPNKPVNQHQNTAPGPPAAIAVATPTILPVPIVAASAVASAAKELTSPLASASGVTDNLIALSVLACINLVRNVKNKCVTTKSISIGAPQSTL